MTMRQLFLNTFSLLLLFILKGEDVYAQQESQYTQYIYNTMSINPAYTGQRGRFTILALYRNQWVGMKGAPETINFSMDTPIGKTGRVGVGAEFIADKIGASSQNTIALNFSYILSLTEKKYLAFGIKGGLSTLSIDKDKLNIYDYSHINLDMTTRLMPVFGLGIYFYTSNWFLGLSSPSLLETTHFDDIAVSTATESMHLYLLGGYVFSLNDNFELKPAGLIKAVKGAPLAVDISLNLVYHKRFVFGLGYRSDAALSAMIGLQITDNIMLGYAYDYNTADIAHYNSGSHEVFLRFEFGSKTNKRKTPPLF